MPPRRAAKRSEAASAMDESIDQPLSTTVSSSNNDVVGIAAGRPKRARATTAKAKEVTTFKQRNSGGIVDSDDEPQVEEEEDDEATASDDYNAGDSDDEPKPKKRAPAKKKQTTYRKKPVSTGAPFRGRSTGGGATKERPKRAVATSRRNKSYRDPDEDDIELEEEEEDSRESREIDRASHTAGDDEVDEDASGDDGTGLLNDDSDTDDGGDEAAETKKSTKGIKKPANQTKVHAHTILTSTKNCPPVFPHCVSLHASMPTLAYRPFLLVSRVRV
jgi:osmotically-inducible protein OsmY